MIIYLLHGICDTISILLGIVCRRRLFDLRYYFYHTWYCMSKTSLRLTILFILQYWKSKTYSSTSISFSTSYPLPHAFQLFIFLISLIHRYCKSKTYSSTYDTIYSILFKRTLPFYQSLALVCTISSLRFF